ncbi:MAG TPA: hypothetical protein VI138_08145 [Candidatus Dormibacteraeota bacterium]
MVLIRDRPGGADPDPGVEALLLRRPASSVFAPGAEVFPGGSVDPADRTSPWPAPVPALEVEVALLVAAVRETFEECGVLLAWTRAGDPCPPGLARGLARLRKRIQAGHPEEFGAGLVEHGLEPAWEELRYCGHWVTPEGVPRIFDTRFFLARLPAGQEASPDLPGELEGLRWASPASALREAEQGQTQLLPPTRGMLERLARTSSAKAAWEASLSWPRQRVQPLLDQITAEHYPGLDPAAIHRSDGEEG